MCTIVSKTLTTFYHEDTLKVRLSILHDYNLSFTYVRPFMPGIKANTILINAIVQSTAIHEL